MSSSLGQSQSPPEDALRPRSGSTKSRQIPFGEFIVFLIKRIRWPWMILPPIILFVEYFLYSRLSETMTISKNPLDQAAVIVLWICVGIALVRTFVRRDAFLLWLTLLAGALLFREYHLMKIATGLTYVFMAGLLIAAWLNFDQFQPHLRNPVTITLIAMTGLTYILTQTLDIDFFKYGHAANAIVEEMMELTGHGMVVVLVLTARPLPADRSHRPEGPKGR